MTMSEDVAGVLKEITRSLPPSLIALLCINAVFMALFMWFMHDLQLARIEAITKLFATCVGALPK